VPIRCAIAGRISRWNIPSRRLTPSQQRRPPSAGSPARAPVEHAWRAPTLHATGWRDLVQGTGPSSAVHSRFERRRTRHRSQVAMVGAEARIGLERGDRRMSTYPRLIPRCMGRPQRRHPLATAREVAIPLQPSLRSPRGLDRHVLQLQGVDWRTAPGDDETMSAPYPSLNSVRTPSAFP